MKVKFLKSGFKPADFPVSVRPEVGLVGRSNAGKSSFLNALTGQRIARVSQTPGKTRLLNFFELRDAVYLVDMPGYGYATGNRREVEAWKHVIEAYLSERETLKGVLLIMDIRRDWAEEEEMLHEWFTHHELAWAVILNKADKLSRSAALQRRRDLAKRLEVPVFVVSSSKKTGLDDVEKLIFKEWAK